MLSFIGKIITQLREENALTVATLAERTGISIERLTDIESGAVVPSVGVLIKISRALGARLGTFLDGHESTGAVVSRREDIVPTGAGGNLGASRSGANRHMEFFAMAAGKKDRSMEPLIVVVQPVEHADDLKSEHEGEEFLFVLEGEIEVKYGSELHRLKAGDSIYYDSIVPHSIVSVCGAASKILAIVYTPY